ncbi:antibiotic biosynthesis monooxygenase [Streptomyces sp. NPDC003691]
MSENSRSESSRTTTARPVVVVPDARPDLGRGRSAVVKISTWDAATPDRQQAVLAAIGTAWRRHDWPAVGLLSYTVHLGDDGRTLLHYSQWADEDAYRRFFTEYRDDRNAEIDAAVPGIARLGLNAYDLYRGGPADPDDTRVPGSIVIAEVEFDGPDPERQRAWVDTVFEAMAADPRIGGGSGEGPHTAGISGWFHLGTDGTRVLNYAEWESAEAHEAALAGPGEGIGSDSEEWRAVRSFPGVRESRVTRYTPGLSLRPGG